MLTVLLATHNGAGTLPRVLEAYQRLTPPMGGWRVVLVDNASTDDTPAILKDFASRLPLLALRTERRGKNVALNLGLEHVDGDLVVLTDDDAVPEAEWLVALSQAAARHQGSGPVRWADRSNLARRTAAMDTPAGESWRDVCGHGGGCHRRSDTGGADLGTEHGGTRPPVPSRAPFRREHRPAGGPICDG